MDTLTDIELKIRDDLRLIFGDDDDKQFQQPPANSMDIACTIHQIRGLEKQIEQFELQQREAKDFYQHRITKCDERINFLKRSILNYLEQHKLKNVVTHAGTAYKKELIVKHWGDEQSLLDWVTQFLPAAIRTKREPDKKAITEHMEKTGEYPDGFSEERQVRLYIK